MLAAVEGVHMDGIQSDVVSVQNSQSDGGNAAFPDYGCGDGVFWDGGIHGGNDSAVYPAGGSLQGKQGIQPLPADILIQLNIDFRLKGKIF